MKCVGPVLVLIGSCSGTSSPTPTALSNAKHAAPRELYCPTGVRKLSALARKEPSEGGYRRLPDETAAMTLRGMIADAPWRGGYHARASTALHAAISDLRDEIRNCMKRADTVTPNLQYTLTLDFIGNTSASIVDGVSLKRLVVKDDGSVGEQDTTAEPCIAAILTLLELPPGGSGIRQSTILRYDFCTSAYDRGRAIAQEYARAFPSWAAAHPGKRCPSRLEDLHEYVRLKDTVDPWGAPFELRCQSDKLEVWSVGRDQVPGTDDDVTSWR